MGLSDNFWLKFAAILCFAAAVIMVLIDHSQMALALFFVISAIVLAVKMSNILWLIIFLTPLSINVSIPGLLRLSLPNEGLLIFFSLLFFIKTLNGLRLKIHFWKHPISVLLLLDLSWTLLSSFTSELPIVSIKRFVIKSLFILIFFYLMPLLIKKRNLFFVYGLGFIVPIVWTTYKHYLSGFGYETSLLTSLPFYDEHAVYAACSAFILPYFLLKAWKQKQHRLFHVLISVLFFLALVLSYSRAAWISLIVSVFLWIFIELRISLKQYKIIFVLSLLTLVVSFNPIYENFKKNSAKYNDEIGSHLISVTNLKDDASNLERINRWICAIEIFKDNPVFGSGPGTYQFVYDRYQYPENMTRISTHHGDNGNAHSEYLMALSENGLIGFLIFLGIVITSFNASIKLLHTQLSNEHKALVISALLGLITFYTHGLFNSFIDSSKMSILVYGSLGIIAAVSTQRNNKNEELELVSD